MFVATKMIFVAAPANDTAPGSVTAVARHTWSSVAGHCDIAGGGGGERVKARPRAPTRKTEEAVDRRQNVTIERVKG